MLMFHCTEIPPLKAGAENQREHPKAQNLNFFPPVRTLLSNLT